MEISSTAVRAIYIIYGTSLTMRLQEYVIMHCPEVVEELNRICSSRAVREYSSSARHEPPLLSREIDISIAVSIEMSIWIQIRVASLASRYSSLRQPHPQARDLETRPYAYPSALKIAD